jgi:hypothetical protein
MTDQENLFEEQDSQCVVCGTTIEPSMDKCPKCGWTWKVKAEEKIVIPMYHTREDPPAEDPMNTRPLDPETPSHQVNPLDFPAPSGQAAGPDPAAIIIAAMICAVIIWFMSGKH